jgi:hypothetical protein
MVVLSDREADKENDWDCELGGVSEPLEDPSLPNRSSSAHRLGSGARDPLASIKDRHCPAMSFSSRPGESNFKTK